MTIQKVSISVVTPCFNAGALLMKLAECMAAQTYQDFEWVIVDDGSELKTLEILNGIESMVGLNVRIIRCEHKGGNTCRNIGTANTIGSHVKYVDADDYMDIAMLEHQYSTAVLHPEAIIVSPTKAIRSDGTTFNLPMPSDSSTDVLGDYLYESWSHHCACLIPRRFIEDIGGWDDHLKYGQDLDFIRRLLMKKIPPKVKCEHRSTFYYRQHNHTDRLSTARKDETGKYQAQMLALTNFTTALKAENRFSKKYRLLIARNYDRWACSAIQSNPEIAQEFLLKAKLTAQGSYPIYGGFAFKLMRNLLGLSFASKLANNPFVRKAYEGLVQVKDHINARSK